MAHHLASIVEEIGHPPNRDHALRLAHELGLQIRLEGIEGFVWTDFLDSVHPVFVLNDAHAALLGEVWQGAAL